MKHHQWISCAAVLVAFGCEVAPKARPASEAPAAASTQPMTLRAGDKVELKFYYAPELNDTQQIRSDGMLTLQLIGDIQAAGRTSAELSNDLKQAYGSQLKYPQCSVIVRESYQRRVYVTGEVQRPGLLELPSDMSAFDAIMASGGFAMTTAQPASVIVIRHGQGNKRVAYKLDFAEALKGADHDSFALQPEDIVFVPRTAIVNVDNWVDQYISSIVPKTGFVYSIGGNN